LVTTHKSAEKGEIPEGEASRVEQIQVSDCIVVVTRVPSKERAEVLQRNRRGSQRG